MRYFTSSSPKVLTCFLDEATPKNLKSPPPEFGAELARRAAEALPMTEAKRCGLVPIY
jgi:hypothetical protein